MPRKLSARSLNVGTFVRVLGDHALDPHSRKQRESKDTREHQDDSDHYESLGRRFRMRSIGSIPEFGAPSEGLWRRLPARMRERPTHAQLSRAAGYSGCRTT